MGVTALSGGAGRAKCFPSGWNVQAKSCDCCSAAPALLFCRADVAFMCLACDARLHGGASAKHERVWMCDVCERAPAAVTCKADAAALCVACDRDIHSANPLARRHDRAPVVPFYDAAAALLAPADGNSMFTDDKLETLIPDSWISTDPIAATTKLPADDPEIKSEFFLSDSDQFLDFDNYQICSSQPYNDSLVPVQATNKPPPVQAQISHQNSPENPFEIDFTRSNTISLYNNRYTTQSLSLSVSSSSMDVGIVPDGGGGAMSETSYPYAGSMSSTDLTANQGSQSVGMDREARVLRYKEKRKNRKFEKTIRYASRKAYAETRPRIKGRFAKRTDSETDIYEIFSAGGADARYGVVPSF
ncbi:zinc finger protein constans-like 5 [Phtheirospermum japonicum]|uniref:Zinc finger protein constans-like 5 n=1 Tax=Phtheirospermum japonicum TaxID=374723 RepID=A0A830C0U7_9LAMI|nr:zinc finger protein constans-like 5 [Phtheirospermum japonicum]